MKWIKIQNMNIEESKESKLLTLVNLILNINLIHYLMIVIRKENKENS
jgi:hypothetical protein